MAVRPARWARTRLPSRSPRPDSPTPSLDESGALPTGVSFIDNADGTGTLAGTPAAGTAGTYDLSFDASNGVGSDALQSFTLTVQAAPAITSANATTFTEGSAGTFTVTSTGNPTASVSETGSLPAGVTLSDNGDGTATLAGTPTVNGTYPITVKASNGVGSDATQSFTLTVDGAPTITSAASKTFTKGTAGSFRVTATGTPTPSIAESGTLPAGVTFTDNGDGTATLAGNPDLRGGLPDQLRCLQRGRLGRRPVLHLDRACRSGHHLGQCHDLQPGRSRNLHGDLDGQPDGGADPDRVPADRCDLQRQW